MRDGALLALPDWTLEESGAGALLVPCGGSWRERVAAHIARSRCGRQPNWRLRLRELGGGAAPPPPPPRALRARRGAPQPPPQLRAPPAAEPPAAESPPSSGGGAPAENGLSFTPTFPPSVEPGSSPDSPWLRPALGSAGSTPRLGRSEGASSSPAAGDWASAPSSPGAAAGQCFSCGRALAEERCTESGLPHAVQERPRSVLCTPAADCSLRLQPRPSTARSSRHPPSRQLSAAAGPPAQSRKSSRDGSSSRSSSSSSSSSSSRETSSSSAPSDGKPFKIGAAVVATGLRNRTELNGRPGTVKGYVMKRGEEHLHVDFEGVGKTTVHPRNVARPPRPGGKAAPAPAPAAAAAAATAPPPQSAPAAAEGIAEGAAVLGKGLVRRPELNGCRGVVRRVQSGPDGEAVFGVEFEGHGTVAVRRKNLDPIGADGQPLPSQQPAAEGPAPGATTEERFPVEAEVVAHGLANRKELNGARGVVRGHQAGPSGETLLRVFFTAQGSTVAVRERNLRRAGAPAAAGAAGAAPPPAGSPGPAGPAARKAPAGPPQQRRSAFRPGQEVISVGLSGAPAGCRGQYLRYEGDGLCVVRFRAPLSRDETVKEIAVREAPQPPRFADGAEVEAVGLEGGVNGCRGTVARSAERNGAVAWVDFGVPHGQVALRETNLQSAVGVTLVDSAGARHRVCPHPSGGLCLDKELRITAPFSSVSVADRPQGAVISFPDIKKTVTVPKSERRVLPALSRLLTAFGVAHDLPAALGPEDMPEGTRVRAHGLAATPRVNGLKGQVVGHSSADGGKTPLVVVRFQNPIGTMVLKLDNVLPDK
eukprot:TRINITY_DN24426_c0_g1_i1.p1 TRINITY_DN24426_c0_g1~~TRINITY_DN24426_c0_g1_i1.p1  ORF type:complete len:848 (+),score=240.47 TRINITY_DN24426_c0_g1_i1:88-2544(+)